MRSVTRLQHRSVEFLDELQLPRKFAFEEEDDLGRRRIEREREAAEHAVADDRPLFVTRSPEELSRLHLTRQRTRA